MLGFYETVERPLAARRRRDGARRHPRRPRRAEAPVGGFRASASPSSSARSTSSPAIPFNIGSPKQLGEVLFDELSLPGGKKGKTGAYGTDAGVLEELALTHDLPARVLDWRQLAKLKSTYADALIGEINPATGRVHTSLRAGRRRSTGRLSLDRSQSAEHPDPHRGRPQDPPRLRRRAGPSADLRRLQPDRAAPRRRISPTSTPLKDAFRNGDDIHALTASQVFGVPMARAWTARSAAAPRRSISASSTASAPSAWRSSSAVPQAEAADYIKAYFARFPGIRDYMERDQAGVRASRAMSRRCSAAAATSPASRDNNPSRRGFAERAGDQRAAARHRRRHHQARHDPHPRRAGASRPQGAHAAAGA